MKQKIAKSWLGLLCITLAAVFIYIFFKAPMPMSFISGFLAVVVVTGWSMELKK